MAPEGDVDVAGDARPPRPSRRARLRSALLWGVVGGLAFLVLAQGYLLLDGDLPAGFVGLVGVALAVGLASGGLAYLTEHRLVAKGRT